MPPVSQPVAALRQAADIADRVTVDQLGQLEDLGHGQDRALGCSLRSARDVERQIQREGLAGQLPLLNPFRGITGSQGGKAASNGREFS